MYKSKKLAGLAISTLAIASFLSGCNSNDSAKPSPAAASDSKAVKAQAQTAATDNTDLRLAGGKFGSESIAFVGGGASNKLWVIDAKYHKLLTTIEPDGPKLERTEKKYPNLHDTHSMTFTKDFKTMFTVDWFKYDEPSYVIALDPKTFKELWRTPVGKGGHHSAMSPDDKYLYVANQYNDTISVVDVQAKKKIKDLPTGKGTDYITPSMYWDGKKIDSPYLFVSVDKEDKVVAFDWKKNEIVKNIPVGGKLHGVNLTPDGKQVWAAVGGAKSVVIIDVATLEIKDKIPFENGPIHLSFSPDGKFAYVTTGGNSIFKIDTKTYEKLWTTTGTVIPAHTGVSPDGKELWTLNHGMDSKRYPYMLGGEVVSGVQVWDTENGQLINDIPSEGPPHEIQFVPYNAVGMPEVSSAEVHAKGTHSIAEAGEHIFKQNCASCHGADLSGGAGPNLQTIGSKLTKEQIAETLKNGKGMMPSGLVSPEDTKILAAWLSEKK